MSRFTNDETGVVVSVSDDKDNRFTSGWTPVAESTSTRKTSAKSTSK